jgi:hypothetical protein
MMLRAAGQWPLTERDEMSTMQVWKWEKRVERRNGMNWCIIWQSNLDIQDLRDRVPSVSTFYT